LDFLEHSKFSTGALNTSLANYSKFIHGGIIMLGFTSYFQVNDTAVSGIKVLVAVADLERFYPHGWTPDINPPTSREEEAIAHQ
jgi:hypothetical protein